MFGIFKRIKLKKIIAEALSDDKLTDEKYEMLVKDAIAAGLGKYYVEQARTQHFNEKIAPILKSKLNKDIAEALSDNKLTDEEYKTLVKDAIAAGLGKHYVNEIRGTHFHQKIAPILNRIESTHRYSPQDEKEINAISKDLQITTSVNEDSYPIFRALWKQENGIPLSLAPIDAGIVLTKKENCFFSSPCSWQQEKIVRERKGYVGGGLSFRVAKGVRMSVGGAVPVVNEYEAMVPIADGDLYITSKKIVFNGAKRSTSITMGRIIQIETYSDAIEIRKTTGKPDFFFLDEGMPEYATLVINDMLENT